MKFHNREWYHGEDARFRTNMGTWNIRIIINHDRDRFSGGWSTFVKDRELKENENLRFTLREEDDIPIFDVEVNPMD